jgi:hypothetical protein
MSDYTTSALIASYLGIALTPPQVTQADAVAAAATAFIDRFTGRSWQAPSAIVAEWSPIVAKRVDGSEIVTPTVYLLHRPVVAVSGVTLRATAPQQATQALDASEYELTDTENGVLRLLLTALWQGRAVSATFPYADPTVASVDYTWAAAPPADIALAATTIGAAQMARLIALASSESLIAEHPEMAGITSLAIGQNDVAVTLTDPSSVNIGADAASSWAAPGSTVEQILRGYRATVIA